jgi:hypothetical protein
VVGATVVGAVAGTVVVGAATVVSADVGATVVAPDVAVGAAVVAVGAGVVGVAAGLVEPQPATVPTPVRAASPTAANFLRPPRWIMPMIVTDAAAVGVEVRRG